MAGSLPPPLQVYVIFSLQLASLIIMKAKKEHAVE